MTEPTHFDLSAEMLLRAQSVVSSEMESRIYLTGAFIEPVPDNGALIIATDGRIMLIQHDKDAVAPEKITLKIGFCGPPNTNQDTCEECGGDMGGYDFSRARAIIPLAVKDHPQAAPTYWVGMPNPFIYMLAESIPAPEKGLDWRKIIGAKYKPTKFQKDRNHTNLFIDPALLQRLAPWARGAKLHQHGYPTAARTVTFEDTPNTIGILMQRHTKYDPAPPLADMLTLIGRADLLDATK